MSRKLHELQQTIGAGARSNKYRVLFPYFSQELDIQCHDIQSPGRSIGTVDIYLKGREFKAAGDRADQGTITLTFYNDPEFLIRRFFLKIIGGIQNYQTPQSIDQSMFEIANSGDILPNDLNTYLNSIKNSETGSTIPNLGINGLLGKVTDTVLAINNAYNQIKNNFNSIQTMAKSLSSGGLQELSKEMDVTSVGYGFYVGKPWYMTDIKVLQLGPDEENLVETTLHNAFVSEVSQLEYTDEIGEISQTTLTITYSGISYGNDKEIRFLERY